MLKFAIIALGVVSLLPPSQPQVTDRESRELRMADQAVLASIAVAAAPNGKKLCSQNNLHCVGPDKAELGLALIGARRSQRSQTALLNLLGYRLDGSVDEDYRCYVLGIGPPIESELAKVKASSVNARCLDQLQKLISSRKDSFEGLDVKSVCASTREIEAKIKTLRAAISRGEKCDSGDF